MSSLVDIGEAPGVVTLVSRNGETHVDAVGEGMKRDTLFRIASMTKPVVAAAAMILVEECRLRLDDPVDEWLPELTDRRVLRTLESPVDDTVPANRPISLRDLLTFRSGHGIVMAMPGTYPIQAAVEAQFGPPGPPRPGETPGPDECMRRMGTLPLIHQPGEQWLYNTGSDILGVLLARVEGKPLGDVLRERIFDPLGMKETGFSVPEEQIDRLPDSYWFDWGLGAFVVFDRSKGGGWSQPPAFPSGAGGLVSTADDYLLFSEMMLRGGAPLLSKASVELMTTNHLTPPQREGGAAVLGSRGWGFGVGVLVERDGLAPVGSYGWDGGLGTSWLADPSHDLTTIVLTQRAFTSPVPPKIIQDFQTCAFAAVE